MIYRAIGFWILLVPLLLGSVAAAVGQESIKAGIALDRDRLTVGDPIIATVLVAHPPHYHMQPPDIAWEGVELLQMGAPQSTAAGSQLQITLTAWVPNSYELAPVALTLVAEDGATLTAVTSPITFTVLSVLDGNDLTLRDIRPQAAPSPTFPWQWLLWLLAVGAVGGGVRLWQQRRVAATIAQIDPSQHALALLEGLTNVEDGDDLATAVSTILRTWLLARYTLPATTRTTSEMVSLLATIGFSQPQVNRFHQLLQQLDTIRFSPRPAVPARTAVLDTARALIVEAPPALDGLAPQNV